MTTEVAVEEAHGEHAHPGDAQYILIALGLAVLTAIEVGIYYLKNSTATTAVLLILMVTKFAIVAGYFMHLRFDSPQLRRLFIGGLVLATFIYTVTLFIFGAFHV